MKRRKLVWQIFSLSLLTIVMCLVPLSMYLLREFKQFHHDQIRAELEARAILVRNQLTEPLNSQHYELLSELTNSLARQTRMRLTIILPDGQIIAESDEDPELMANHAERPEIKQALSGEIGQIIRKSETVHEEMMYLAIPCYNGQSISGVVRTALPITRINQTMSRLVQRVVLTGLLLSLLTLMVSLFISRRITRPLLDIQKHARAFAQGDFKGSIPVPDIEEIALLVHVLNDAASQLETRFQTILHQKNEKDAILTSMIEGLLAIDLNEQLITLNHSAAHMLGLSIEKSQGRLVQEVIRHSELQKFIHHSLTTPGPREDMVTFLHPQTQFVYVHGTQIVDHRGQTIGAIVVLHDITRMKRLENMRRDFVANVSHELRTPLTALQGFLETLQDGALSQPEEAQRFLTIMHAQVTRMGKLIEDILLLSSLEQDTDNQEIALNLAPLLPTIQSAIQTCEHKAREKDITISLQGKTDIELMHNPELLSLALINLLDNAIKYSDQDSTVTLSIDQQEKQTVIAVIDHGCGIPHEHQDRVFERFYRVDKARSRKLGGTGLGLAIVKHIAVIHNATVILESSPDQGSTFSLHFPAIPNKPNTIPDIPANE